MDKHALLFNNISWAFQLFYNYQRKGYRKNLMRVLPKLNLSENSKVLDLGCGAGALGSVFIDLGFDVTGVDIAPKMVERCKKNHLKCILGNIIEGLPFVNKSFDLVVSAYVLHGLNSIQRNLAYKEISRLSKKYILFYDYKSPGVPTNLGVRFIEMLEGGDYFGFIMSGFSEMQAIFPKIQYFSVNSQSGFYLIVL